jgi:ketosteroid isomerase-like protein
MTERAGADIVLESFDAVERRDSGRLARLYHPDVEFHWAPSLPYGGTARGIRELQSAARTSWEQVWNPLQPTERERRMDPRLVAATDREVVVLYRQRGVRSDGERLDMETVGLYQVRDGKFARAQMFYFDTTAVLHFLREPDGGGHHHRL